MDIYQKIGLFILMWTVIYTILSVISNKEERGKYAVEFWTTTITTGIILLL